MKLRKCLVIAFLTLAAASVVFRFLLVARAGNLEPSAPPGSTMKTLDEIEPRIPIHSTDLPLTISQSGSYYLAENITFSTVDTNGIAITVSNVTIDLSGFVLQGPGSGSAGGGIATDQGSVENITIMNGTITGWYRGINLSGRRCEIRDIKLSSCISCGIYADNNSMITGCSAHNCAVGIRTGAYSVIKDCVTTNNSFMYMGFQSGTGINAGVHSTVSNCTASNNGICGISTASNVIVENCTANSNGATGISAASNCVVTRCSTNENQYWDGISWAGDGIKVLNGAVVSKCTASGNKITGIIANSDCVITECTAYDNKYTGISVNRSRVTNCTVSENDVRGIHVQLGCSLFGNTIAGNDVGILLVNTGNIVRDNNIYSNTTYGLDVMNTGNYSAQNTFNANGTNIHGTLQQGTGDMANVIIP